MAILQCAEAVGSVRSFVFGVAHTDRRTVQDVQHQCEHLFLWQSWPRQILLDPLADGRQTLPESDHVMELRAAADERPLRVITVLLPSARVLSGSLQMAIPQWADPYVGPGGW